MNIDTNRANNPVKMMHRQSRTISSLFSELIWSEAHRLYPMTPTIAPRRIIIREIVIGKNLSISNEVI